MLEDSYVGKNRLFNSTGRKMHLFIAEPTSPPRKSSKAARKPTAPVAGVAPADGGAGEQDMLLALRALYPENLPATGLALAEQHGMSVAHLSAISAMSADDISRVREAPAGDPQWGQLCQCAQEWLAMLGHE